MLKDYLSLFKTIDKFKDRGGGEFVGCCPLHDDKKESFSGNYIKGVFKCYGCGKKGHISDFAKELGMHNYKEYFTNTSDSNYTAKNITYVEPTKTLKDHSDTMNRYIKNLKDDMSIWDDKLDLWLIDDLGIGYDGKGFVFGYYEGDKCIGIKHHKPSYWEKDTDGSGKWYPLNELAKYDKNKTLYICEGEKDVISLKSRGFQAVSVSGGCNFIPKDKSGEYDLLWLKEYDDIVIVYDNDKYGVKGAKNLSKEITLIHSHITIRLAQWDKDLGVGFDVYDSMIADNYESFDKAVDNSIIVKAKRKQERGLILMNGVDALNEDIPDDKMIIDNILPEKSQIILGGAEGSNKSFYAMQMGMSVANNEKEFLSFNINIHNQRVLFFDTEQGIKRLNKRYIKISQQLKNFNDNGAKRFFMASNKGTLTDVLKDLNKAIDHYEPDIVIFDCLYNIIGDKDGSRNNVLLPILNSITDITLDNDITMFVVAHFNKGEHNTGLHIDRIQGAGALKNWLEHCILITYTNDESIRLMRFAKSRDGSNPKCYYELGWDYPMLSNLGVSTDWGQLLVTTERKHKWDLVLQDLPNEFNTYDFKNIVVNRNGMCDKTATNWLKAMVDSGVLKKTSHSQYIKNLKVRGKV